MAHFQKPEMSLDDRGVLQRLRKSPDGSAEVASRAAMVLWAADGKSAAEIAGLAGVAINTVRLWVARYVQDGADGLRNTPHPGKPRQIEDSVRGRIVALTRASPPAVTGLSHWSSRTMVDYLRQYEQIGVSRMFVTGVWAQAHLKPWRQGTFKLSRDPLFAEKVASVVGLYLDPPAGAVVLSVDEKSQCEALDRTQPMLPMAFDVTEQRTHDYVRHGTTTLFAALNVGTGEVLGECFTRHTSTDFLRFMDQVVTSYPDTDLHVVLDNFATHKSPTVVRWLDQHPRVRFHFTPVSGSWLNQVEMWFGIITRQAIRRGTFSSLRQLITAITTWTAHWNTNPTPFTWTATADSILAKVRIVEQSVKKLTGH